MNEFISRIVSITPPFNMIVMVVFLIVVAGVITAIASEIRKYFCRRDELEFKRELVDRGMSADEIERVVKAGSQSSE